MPTADTPPPRRSARKAGFKKAFGTLSSKVYRWVREEKWGPALRQAFAEYAAGKPDLAVTVHAARRYAPGAEIRHRFVSMTEAHKALGVSPGTISRLAQRRGLFVLPPQGSGVASLVRADVFRAIQDEMADYLLPEEARLLLGVGRKVMDQIEEAGLIRRLPPEDLVMEIRPYRKSEVQAFVDACAGSAPAITKEEADRRKLATIISSTAPGRTVPDICRAIVEGG